MVFRFGVNNWGLHLIFIESKVGVEVILKDFLEIALDIYMVK
ncbi:Uncharacterised protein [Streptococcus pneumoniae]|nr:Uncharacterised protein [Streptococcus pneumoniae]